MQTLTPMTQSPDLSWHHWLFLYISIIYI